MFETVDGCCIIIESLSFEIITIHSLCHRFYVRFLSVWLGPNITTSVPYPVPPYTTSSFHLPLSIRTMRPYSLLVTSSKLKRDLDTLIKVAWIVLDHSTSWVGIGSQWLWLLHWFVASDQDWSGSVQLKYSDRQKLNGDLRLFDVHQWKRITVRYTGARNLFHWNNSVAINRLIGFVIWYWSVIWLTDWLNDDWFGGSSSGNPVRIGVAAGRHGQRFPVTDRPASPRRHAAVHRAHRPRGKATYVYKTYLYKIENLQFE